MPSDNLNKILLIVLVILSGLSLYLMFTGNKNIREARKEITNIKIDLKSAKDSIKASRIILDSVFIKMDNTKKQLEIIKDERKKLEQNIKIMLSNNRQQWTSIQEQLDSLNKKEKENDTW